MVLGQDFLIMTKSITFIVKKFLLSGMFPVSWKQAKVTPLYKNGSKDEINNYRFISVLPTLSKRVEKLIQKNLLSFLNDFDVIHKSKNGFRSGHSIETALLLMIENWLKVVNDGNIVGTVMVDKIERKALDLVDHDLLLQKLELYKCSNLFLKLMKSYLNNKSQAVSLGGKMPQKGIVTCGVPQGSILGPLFFFFFFLNIYKWLKIMLLATHQKRLHINKSILSLTYNNIDLQCGIWLYQFLIIVYLFTFTYIAIWAILWQLALGSSCKRINIFHYLFLLSHYEAFYIEMLITPELLASYSNIRLSDGRFFLFLSAPHPLSDTIFFAYRYY